MNDKPRALSRHETHDLGMIIKDRARVLRSHIEERAVTCMADFEQKLAAEYSFDQDEVWRAAAVAAQEVVQQSRKTIATRCVELGIPAAFAPHLEIIWQGRGENALRERREELCRVAKSQIEAMSKKAVTKIEHTSLDLRTQVVAMGLLSPEAKLFLESLAPIDEVMRALDMREVELEADGRPRRLGRYGY